jgi:hypothetical protein
MLRKIPSLIWSLPSAVISWVIVLFIWLFWGTNIQWCDGLWCELKLDSWPSRTWYKKWKGTTFVWGGFVSHGKLGRRGVVDTPVEVHEHIHTSQFNDFMLLSFLYGLSIFIHEPTFEWLIHGSVVWATGSILGYVCSSIHAFILGNSPYRGNMLEKAAYSLVREWENKK